MVPNIHLSVPLLPRWAAPFLLLLSCTVMSSLADSVPNFIKSPEDQIGISGGVASFVCQANGDPKPRIRWISWTFMLHRPTHSNERKLELLIDKMESPLKVSYIFPNGDSYGVVMRSGPGKQTSANGVLYTGEWHDDKMNGRATVKYPSGALYEGEFKDNRYHGSGTYTFPDGSKYTGAFFNNRLEGEGTFTCTKGLVWTGDFHGKAALGLKLDHHF